MKDYALKHPIMTFWLIVIALMAVDSMVCNCCKAYVIDQALKNHVQINLNDKQVHTN